MLGAATDKAINRKLGTKSCYEIDDLSCLKMFNIWRRRAKYGVLQGS